MIYLDNAATSWPKAPGVAEEAARVLTDPYGNPGRNSHEPGIAASRLLFEARETLCSFTNWPDSSTLIFTQGTTDSLHLVIQGLVPRPRRILVSSLEHNSVMRPVTAISRDGSLCQWQSFRSLPGAGFPDLSDLETRLKDFKPDMVISTGASNVSGALFPWQELTEICRKEGIPFCLDAAQLLGEVPVDFSLHQPDFVCFSGHKGLLGPSGTGGLFVRDPDRIDPVRTGGTGSHSESFDQPGFMPDKLESGTPNLTGIAGMTQAVNWRASRKEPPGDAVALTRLLSEGISEIPKLKVIHPAANEPAVPVISLVCEETVSADLCAFLDEQGIALRYGLHCAPAAHRFLGTLEVGGTLRFSPGPFTVKEHIEQVLQLLKEYEW